MASSGAIIRPYQADDVDSELYAQLSKWELRRGGTVDWGLGPCCVVVGPAAVVTGPTANGFSVI